MAMPRTIYYICVRSALILVCLFAFTGCYSRSKPSSIGTSAPDFTITDSDRSVSLTQLRGKIVVLNFWATWCPPCVDEMPSLEQLQKKLQGTDITILAVSVDDDADDYHRFLKQHAIDLLTVRESGRKTDTGVIAPVSSSYGTFKVPETYIIDRNGVIRRKFIGEVNWGQPEIMEYLSRL
jgi:cytochrome c biogenesis protein CcmG, thiol:disulfide interchange protein DsbE